MSKVNQIQQALKEMSGGKFQKLADAYLVEKGLGRISSIGSVVAANKVKTGTPDTLIATPEGNYIFAEHTTRETGLLAKMKDDLGKCFDESKTGVPIEKIERVIFCFTGELDGREENELAEACQEKDVNLDLFGLDALAFDLYSKYPALARDFLGVPIDTGQIVSPERFISLYNNNKLATRLDLGFHFREDELDGLLDKLESENLVVLSGHAGVGKSRLALEACERFSEVYPEYEVQCVFGRNRDLWGDLKARFSKPGHFLVLVDDANRVSRFEYIVDLLQHQREDQQIKVVATVRNYALTKVREAAQPLRGYREVTIEPFTEKQVEELIADEYEINNDRYLERISDIARGNPRLAVMAAEVAKEGPLNSIHDVSDLYDIYFSSIREDLGGKGADPVSADLLRVAAIVSFFKAVDRTGEKMMSAIGEALGVSRAAFWEAADRLHEMEMLDMHEDEVVRVSDQVLGTYLFYLAVFKEGVLDFGALLTHFFPELRHRLIDSINPVLNAFDSKRIIDRMRPDIKRVWKELEEAGDEKGLLHLINVFWFTSQTNTLLWVHAKIDELEPEPVEVNNITFEKDSNAVPSPSILSVLRQFAFVGEDEVRIAIDHLLRYLGKRPAETPRLLRVLIDDYGFRPDSYLRRFEVQRTVVDMLWNRAEDGDPLFSRMFLAVAGNYLHIHFENHGMKDDRVLQIRRFELTATEDLAALREAIWQRVFILHEQEDLQDEILALIRHYSMSALEVKNSEVVRADVKHVLPFLESVLEPSSYLHCTAMHDYLDLLEEHDQEVSDDLRDRFRNDTFVLSEILLPDWGVVPELELSLDEYKQYKRDRLEEHTGDYTLNDYARFFEHCLIIREALDEQGNERQIEGEVINALLTLADRDSDLYARVLGHYLELGDPLRLNSYALVQKLVEQQGPDTAFQLLSESKFGTKRRWLFQVPEALPADDIDEEMLAPLFELYASAEPADLPHGFDYLLKYLPLDQRVVAEVVSKVVKKVDHNPDFACVLAMLFNPHTEVAKRLPVLFAEDLNLLKRAYLIAEGTQHHGDYKGQVFDSLLDFDPTFMTEYIEWKYEHAERRWLSSHNDHRDYAFIWSRPDHQEVMDLVVESVYGHDQDSFFSIDPYLKVFFQVRGGSEAEREARERQDAYLLRLIDEHCEDMKFTEYLFRLIAQFSPERRHPFVERFVQRNEDIEAFKGLQLEPNSWTSYGSWVPVLQGRVDYWESLLPLMNTVDLLPHKQYVEREIRALRASIEQEKKKDFIGG